MNCQFSVEKVKGKGHQTSKNRKLASCLLMGDQSSAGGSGADCKLGLRHC